MKQQTLAKFTSARLSTALALLAAGVLLGACNGSVTSVSLPAASPWVELGTIVASPYDDVTVVAVGSDLSAGIIDAIPGAVCTSDQGGFFAFCASAGCSSSPLTECVDDAPTGATNVGFSELTYLYAVDVMLDRPTFTAGGIQLQSIAGGMLGAIAIDVGGGGQLNIGAGFNEGLIAGPAFDEQFEAYDDFSFLFLGPSWEDFGPGHVCSDGTTTSCDPDVGPEGILAACDAEGGDVILLRTNAVTPPYSLTCGSVTVNINVNPPFDTVGECISTLKAQHCNGLHGKAKAACNHAQIGVCHATFNVPSSHS